MPTVHETAYPRLKNSIDQRELIDLYTPTEAELELAVGAAKGEAAKLSFLVLLKTFQRLGYFIALEEVPRCIVESSRAASGRRSISGRPAASRPFQVALYARVSTHDQQTLPLQIKSMREYAIRRGWQVVEEIREVGSGALQRPKREELLAAVRRREVDAILVWRLDRWGRSLPDLVVT
jgi:hypothetical protein